MIPRKWPESWTSGEVESLSVALPAKPQIVALIREYNLTCNLSSKVAVKSKQQNNPKLIIHPMSTAGVSSARWVQSSCGIINAGPLSAGDVLCDKSAS